MDARKHKSPHCCPAHRTIEVLSGQWKVPIVWKLADVGTLRFSQLRDALPGITQKVLTQQLRELEADGVVFRRVYPQVPPKVEYSLTTMGKTLTPVINAMCNWGRNRTIAGRRR